LAASMNGAKSSLTWSPWIAIAEVSPESTALACSCATRMVRSHAWANCSLANNAATRVCTKLRTLFANGPVRSCNRSVTRGGNPCAASASTASSATCRTST
jgi:hypothetical protein